jgi:hypothetical protein
VKQPSRGLSGGPCHVSMFVRTWRISIPHSYTKSMVESTLNVEFDLLCLLNVDPSAYHIDTITWLGGDLVVQDSERTYPRDHYTTAPSVITCDTRVTSPRRLIPTSAIKNTSKNRKNTIKTALITRWGITNRWTSVLFDDIYDLSKTHTLMWRQLLSK